MEEKIALLGYGTYVNDKIPFAYSYVYGDNTILNDVNTHGYHVAGIAAANASDSGINAWRPTRRSSACRSSTRWTAAIPTTLSGPLRTRSSWRGHCEPEPGQRRRSSSDWNFITAPSGGLRPRAWCAACPRATPPWPPSRRRPTTTACPTGPVNDLGLVDTAIIASPSSAESALSVASVQNVGTLLSQGPPWRRRARAEICCAPTFFPAYDLSSWERCASTTWARVITPNTAPYDDNWEGVNKFTDEELAEMKGQIALVQRGDIEFHLENILARPCTPALAASSSTTTAIPTWPPTAWAPMDYSQIPAIIVSGADGAYLKTLAEERTDRPVHRHGGEHPRHRHRGCGDLSLLLLGPHREPGPEAGDRGAGGNIYSLAGGVDGYQTMSGTSMAVPYASGAEALLVQAIRARGMELSGQELTDFLKQNMMNTRSRCGMWPTMALFCAAAGRRPAQHRGRRRQSGHCHL